VGPPITAPTKPGMIKMTSGSCLKVPMELYDLPLQNVGAFISKVGSGSNANCSDAAVRAALCGACPHAGLTRDKAE